METEFHQDVEFIKVNASTAAGLEIFTAYSLFGHPAYLILDQQGEILWQSVGELPLNLLEEELNNSLGR